MTGESGYVASEGFPNLYPPSKECIWTITVRRPLWSLLFVKVSEAWVQAAKSPPPAPPLSLGKSKPPPVWSLMTFMSTIICGKCLHS